MSRIQIVAAAALLTSGCAASPANHANAAPVRAVSPPLATAPVPAPAKRMMNGFVRVMKGGVPTYCRDEVKTGSHIITQQRCLAQGEFDRLEEDTARDVERIRNTIVPNTGASGH